MVTGQAFTQRQGPAGGHTGQRGSAWCPWADAWGVRIWFLFTDARSVPAAAGCQWALPVFSILLPSSVPDLSGTGRPSRLGSQGPLGASLTWVGSALWRGFQSQAQGWVWDLEASQTCDCSSSSALPLHLRVCCAPAWNSVCAPANLCKPTCCPTLTVLNLPLTAAPWPALWQ